MKGIIFNLVEEVVVARWGADAWDDLIDAAGVSGVYTSLGSYPDEDLAKLAGAAAAALGLPLQTVIRTVGEDALPLLAVRYPEFFAGHSSAHSFLLTLNDIIHPEVRKLYPGADVPEFDFDTSEPGVIVLGYRSPRRLCALAEGFVAGSARHWGETVEIEQTACMHEGADACSIRCRFTR